jgi:hypothetical protein
MAFTSSPAAALAALATVATAVLAGPAPAATAAPAAAPKAATTALTGTLRLTPGSCAGGRASGTYFRMILPSGGVNGPYLANNDSTCSDQSFTPLSPGTDGGLRLGSYQPIPTPAFAANGDARARRLTAPARFYGTSFATATNQVDPQTKTSVPAPQVTVTGSTLSADLRSFSVTWNNQHFNQGAPKPDGSLPGVTHTPTGRYDAATGAFRLDWTSQIVGGPFDKFTGKWHLEGRYVPASGAIAPTKGSGTGSSPSVPGTTTTTTGTVAGTTPTRGTTQGTATRTGTPATGAIPAAGSVVAAPNAAAATTKVVTKQDWKVSWPVIWLAGGLAILGFAAVILLGRADRSGRRSTVA